MTKRRQRRPFPGLEDDPREILSFRYLISGTATLPDDITALVLNTELLIAGDDAKDHITIDVDGIAIQDGATVRGRWQTDGDVFIGSDLSTPAGTYLSIFANAQTYNSEAMAAGDMLIGDNSASKANILWDKSAGQLLFRGGTTTAAYIDTSGDLTAGGGNLVLNASGITMLNADSSTPAATNAIAFRNAGGTVTGGLYGTDEAAGPINRLHLLVNNEASHYAYLLMEADAAASTQALTIMQAKITGGATNYIQIAAGGFGPGILIASSVDGLNVDTMHMILPRITTTERDALSPVAGMIIYNTTNGVVEAYEGSAWVNL